MDGNIKITPVYQHSRALPGPQAVARGPQAAIAVRQASEQGLWVYGFRH